MEDASPDCALVEAARRGDAAATRALWDQHRRWVAAILLAHKPRQADVDDLLQDVAVALVARLSTLDEPRAFLPWLRTVAVNVARLAGRRVAAGPRWTGLDDHHDHGPADDAHHAPLDPPGSDAHEAQRLMDLALDLPPDYREPLLLRCVQNLSHRQIGSILGLPETTIETRIARARRMLRDAAAQRQHAADTARAHRRAAAERALAGSVGAAGSTNPGVGTGDLAPRPVREPET